LISSSTNSQIKNILLLQKKAKARNESKSFVIEGIKMYKEIPSDMIIKTYVSEEFYNSNKDVISSNNGFIIGDYEIVSDKVFKEISQTVTPQGIMAIVKQPKYDFESIIKKDKLTLVFLEDLRDPGNLGTIIRTAEGANVDGIVLSKESVDVFNPKVIRSTMGAVYRMPFIYEDNFTDALINKYKKAGIHLYAAYLDNSNDYAKVFYNSKTGIIIGNEANGISDKVKDIANSLIKIPMTGSVESLNAAISAAVIMYEIYRQNRLD